MLNTRSLKGNRVRRFSVSPRSSRSQRIAPESKSLNQSPASMIDHTAGPHPLSRPAKPFCCRPAGRLAFSRDRIVEILPTNVFAEPNRGPTVQDHSGRLEPSLDQIRKRCQAIQASWSKRGAYPEGVPTLGHARQEAAAVDAADSEGTHDPRPYPENHVGARKRADRGVRPRPAQTLRTNRSDPMQHTKP